MNDFIEIDYYTENNGDAEFKLLRKDFEKRQKRFLNPFQIISIYPTFRRDLYLFDELSSYSFTTINCNVFIIKMVNNDYFVLPAKEFNKFIHKDIGL